MYTTEIDKYCLINAPESTSWNIFKRDDAPMNPPSMQEPSTWLWIVPVITTVAAVAAVFLATVLIPNEKPVRANAGFETPVHEVVITGKRMSAQEKLNFDLAPEQIARVEIVGRRLTTTE